MITPLLEITDSTEPASETLRHKGVCIPWQLDVLIRNPHLVPGWLRLPSGLYVRRSLNWFHNRAVEHTIVCKVSENHFNAVTTHSLPEPVRESAALHPSQPSPQGYFASPPPHPRLQPCSISPGARSNHPLQSAHPAAALADSWGKRPCSPPRPELG